MADCARGGIYGPTMIPDPLCGLLARRKLNFAPAIRVLLKTSVSPFPRLLADIGLFFPFYSVVHTIGAKNAWGFPASRSFLYSSSASIHAEMNLLAAFSATDSTFTVFGNADLFRMNSSALANALFLIPSSVHSQQGDLAPFLAALSLANVWAKKANGVRSRFSSGVNCMVPFKHLPV